MPKASKFPKFEVKMLIASDVNIETEIDPSKIEEHFTSKGTTVTKLSQRVNLVVMDDGVEISKALWWPSEKLTKLDYNELKNIYTSHTDTKRLCIDIASTDRNKRRLILCSVKRPMERYNLVNLLQKRKLFARVYEEDNLEKVEYGEWVSSYTLRRKADDRPLILRPTHALGSGEEEPTDIPEPDYPEQFGNELEMEEPPLMDYYFNDQNIQYARNEASLFAPGYNQKAKDVMGSNLMPNQWGQSMMPGAAFEPIESHLTGGGIHDGGDINIMKPPNDANRVTHCVSMLKYVFPGQPFGGSSTEGISSVRNLLCTLSDDRFSVKTQMVIRIQPREEVDQSVLSKAENPPSEPPMVTRNWIQVQPEPMKVLAN